MELSDCPWNEQHLLLHAGLQGRRIAFERLPPNNLVFLLDVSGSMNSPDKLPLLKQAMGLLTEQMCSIDRVAIVVYAGAAGLVRLIEEKRKSGIYLTVLGFGTGNYKDSRMESLADSGNGNYAYIDSEMEARKALVAELGGTLYTIAGDVKIQIEFNPVIVDSYRLIGYENRILRTEDFADDRKDAGEMGAESSNELLLIKFRYKKPGEEQSRYVEKPVLFDPLAPAETSDNYRFSAAVAAFALILRDSIYKGTADYQLALGLAEQALGEDREWYRKEFLGLVKTAQWLDR